MIRNLVVGARQLDHLIPQVEGRAQAQDDRDDDNEQQVEIQAFDHVDQPLQSVMDNGSFRKYSVVRCLRVKSL
jgi:hypothetical protein